MNGSFVSTATMRKVLWLGVVFNAVVALMLMFTESLGALVVVGKTGAAIVALVCLLRGDIQLRTFSVAIGDLAFATYFHLWLRATATRP